MSKSVWLVEDLLSRQRLEQEGITAICLLGTNIHNSLVDVLINKHSDCTIVLALDADATAKSVYWKQTIGYLFRNFTVCPLSKDIKDMTEEELRVLLESNK